MAQGKLTQQDIAEAQKMYFEGTGTDPIGEASGVSGQYIRKLAKQRNWAELRQKHIADTSKAVAKAIEKETVKAAVGNAAKSVSKSVAKAEPNADEPATRKWTLLAKTEGNYRKDTPVTRKAILEQLRRGGSRAAACRVAGIDPGTLKRWCEANGEWQLQVMEAESDFVGGLEALACEVATPKEALSLLERHPLTRKEWGKQESNKNTIRIEFAYSRHQQNVIEGEFQSVEDTPQIEGGN